MGARLPKGCMFFHLPVESGDIEQCLRSKGFSGNRPSIWAMQVMMICVFSIKSSILSCNLYECYDSFYSQTGLTSRVTIEL